MKMLLLINFNIYTVIFCHIGTRLLHCNRLVNCHWDSSCSRGWCSSLKKPKNNTFFKYYPKTKENCAKSFLRKIFKNVFFIWQLSGTTFLGPSWAHVNPFGPKQNILGPRKPFWTQVKLFGPKFHNRHQFCKVSSFLYLYCVRWIKYWKSKSFTLINSVFSPIVNLAKKSV